MIAAAMASAAGMASALESGAAFATRAMIGIAYVALSVTSFVSLEMVEWLRPALGHRAVVAIMGIIAVVDVTVEAMRAVKPGAGSDEDSAAEPIRPVVAVGRAVVGGVVVVPVGTNRSCPDAYPNLGR